MIRALAPVAAIVAVVLLAARFAPATPLPGGVVLVWANNLQHLPVLVAVAVVVAAGRVVLWRRGRHG